jgi:glycosyltransferase involved in cell wall biosynthesis
LPLFLSCLSERERLKTARKTLFISSPFFAKQMQKTIVLIGPAYPYRGGNALFMSHLYEALAPHFRVHYINYTLLYPSLLFPGTTQFDQSERLAKRIPSERLLSSVNPASWLRTARRVKELKPDLVAFDWWNPFFGPCHYAVASLLGRKYQNKILCIAENVISHEARFIDTTLTNLGLRRASSFLALSRQVARDLEAFAGEKPIFTSELPVFGDFYAQTALAVAPEAAKQEFGFQPDDDVALFFGYVRKYKGLDILLRAMPEIVRARNSVKLLVAGEFYDNPEPYYQIIKELNLEGRVKIINKFIPNEEVAKFYAACDFVALPYRSATQSGILGIAYGFERPVVITNVGGLAESVDEGKTGFVVEPESPSAFAKAVIQFYERRSSVNYAEHVRARAQANAFADIHRVFGDILAASR